MCSIFGLLDTMSAFSAKDRVVVMSNLAIASECRGTDATGFAYNHNGYLSVVKRPVAAHRMRLRLLEDSHVIIGHTRMGTQGKASLNYNNHPFIGKVDGTHFALAHNGILYNDDTLRKGFKLPASKIQTDSYIAVKLIEYQKNLNFKSLGFMCEQLMGVFTFAILDSNDNTWLVKGDNPLCIYRSKEYGFIVFASTEEILKTALKYSGIDKLRYEDIGIKSGEILKITSCGKIEHGEFDFDSWVCDSRVGYWGSYGWNSKDWESHKKESEEIQQLKEISRMFGVYEDEIDLLLDFGYEAEEISDMLNYPFDLRRIVQEIEFEFC